MFSEKILNCLKAPGYTDDYSLEISDNGFFCRKNGIFYPNIDDIPSLFNDSTNDFSNVTDRIKMFYEENPFPSYEGLEEFGELVNKGCHNEFSTHLLKSIGYNKLILECGCGTGQLSHFLQLNNNHVLGIDLSLSSLRLALEHKQHNNLVRSNFAQMNIFDLAIKDNMFDVVISHGVLHHTYDAKLAFNKIIQKLKPGGFVMVGLYNKFARVPSWLRSKAIRFFGKNMDYVVRNRILDSRKADIWVNDQYFNPHETWHSIDEVRQWFLEYDIEYLNCYPSILGVDYKDKMELFSKNEFGNWYQRFITQLSWLASIAKEGALFDLIGIKR